MEDVCIISYFLSFQLKFEEKILKYVVLNCNNVKTTETIKWRTVLNVYRSNMKQLFEYSTNWKLQLYNTNS